MLAKWVERSPMTGMRSSRWPYPRSGRWATTPPVSPRSKSRWGSTSFIDAYLRPAFATIDPQDPEGSILGLLTFAEAMSTESGRNGCFLLNAGIEFNHSDPDISDRISSVYGELDDRLILALRAGEQRGELAPGVDPTSLASLFRTYFEGLMSRARHGGGPGSSGPGMDALRVLFRSGRTT
jgi:hypothetical protein